MNIWKFIQEKLSQQMDLMLLVVLTSKGSSPGKQGFKMAVTKTKYLFGSIGGGNMEYEMVELAYSMLNSGKVYTFLKHQQHSEEQSENLSGMICSGEQTIAFIPLNHEFLPIIKKINQAKETSGEGIIKITENKFEYLSAERLEIPYDAKIKSDDEWEYAERINCLNKICIIGAGHVGLALSKIMKDLDFIVEIYDDRLGLNTFENNEYVNKKLRIDYGEIDQLIPQGDNIYVVIMTFAHQSDEVVLSKLINKKFKYLGMMGSDAKVKRIYKNLGYDKKDTSRQKIFAPIGIPINSKTPAEIAISIASEIIRVKNSPVLGY